mgnify:CR=1 FL=1|jgi:hypothetical protein
MQDSVTGLESETQKYSRYACCNCAGGHTRSDNWRHAKRSRVRRSESETKAVMLVTGGKSCACAASQK